MRLVRLSMSPFLFLASGYAMQRCSDPALDSDSDANRSTRVLRQLRRAAVGPPLHASSELLRGEHERRWHDLRWVSALLELLTKRMSCLPFTSGLRMWLMCAECTRTLDRLMKRMRPRQCRQPGRHSRRWRYVALSPSPSPPLSLSPSLSCLLQHWCRAHIRAVCRRQGHTTPLRWTILQAHWRAARWLKTYSTG